MAFSHAPNVEAGRLLTSPPVNNRWQGEIPTIVELQPIPAPTSRAPAVPPRGGKFSTCPSVDDAMSSTANHLSARSTYEPGALAMGSVAVCRRAGRSLLRGDFRRGASLIMRALTGRNSNARRASADPGSRGPSPRGGKFSTCPSVDDAISSTADHLSALSTYKPGALAMGPASHLIQARSVSDGISGRVSRVTSREEFLDAMAKSFPRSPPV